MYRRAEQIFYASAIALLMAVLFVVRPAGSNETAGLQGRIGEDVSVAFTQLVGDEPLLLGVSSLWDGVFGFFDQSSDYLLTLLKPTSSEYVLAAQLEEFSYAFSQVSLALAVPSSPPGIETSFPDEMAMIPEIIEEPIYNIVPEGYRETAEVIAEPEVAGAAIFKRTPTGSKSWMTIEDAITRQQYCLAIYNGEVNKYLGECHYEFN